MFHSTRIGLITAAETECATGLRHVVVLKTLRLNFETAWNAAGAAAVADWLRFRFRLLDIMDRAIGRIIEQTVVFRIVAAVRRAEARRGAWRVTGDVFSA